MSSKAFACPERSSDNTQPPAKRRFGPATPVNMLSFFHERQQNFDREELEFLSDACDTAAQMSEQLADVVNAVGCVIAWDYQPGELRCGSFENGDTVAKLLLTIADQVAVIGEITRIGAEAAFTLKHKESGHG